MTVVICEQLYQFIVQYGTSVRYPEAYKTELTYIVPAHYYADDEVGCESLGIYS